MEAEKPVYYLNRVVFSARGGLEDYGLQVSKRDGHGDRQRRSAAQGCRYSALECYGIVGMASKRTTDGFVQLFGRENLGRGVRVLPEKDSVVVELYIIVEYGISIGAVAETIIDTVKYKVEHLTGIKVSKVHITVEDIRV